MKTHLYRFVILWCIGVSELVVVLGDEVGNPKGDTEVCLREWHPKPGTGGGSRLFLLGSAA